MDIFKKNLIDQLITNIDHLILLAVHYGGFDASTSDAEDTKTGRNKHGKLIKKAEEWISI